MQIGLGRREVNRATPRSTRRFPVARAERIPESAGMPFLPAALLLIALLKGVAIGVVIALPVGPVGVLCVRRTVFEGPTYGFVSGVGAATADTVFGIIAATGLTFLRDWLLSYQDWFGIAGGVFLLFVGVRTLLLPPTDRETEPLSGERHVTAYFSTFALTITNPITILAFAAIFARVGVSESAGIFTLAALVLGVFTGSLCWWLGLSFGLSWLQRVAGSFHIAWVNRISGSILAVSGVGLLGAAIKALARI
jgi:threonine/homoserine/homoserine lactone efflux protein